MFTLATLALTAETNNHAISLRQGRIPAPDYNRRCYGLQALFVLPALYDSLSFKSLVKGPRMKHFLDWREHAGASAEKFYKTTLWQGEHVMVGLNCLEPNQTQSAHAHQGADKFYFVLEGEGKFTVGNEERYATAGSLVVAPAGIAHGVANMSGERLSLLVAIAPLPK